MKKLLLLTILLISMPVYAADYYTAATARTQVRALLSEASASFWTDDEIDNWIKEAVEDISSRSGCIQTSDTISLVTGTYEYATTDGGTSVADVIDVLGIIYVVTTDITGDTNQRFLGLVPISPSDVKSIPLVDSGPPKYYYVSGDKVGILPLPTATENGQTIRIYYTTPSQTIGDLPNEYQSLTFWYAAAMAYKKEHRYTEADKFYQMYLQKLGVLSKVKPVRQEVKQ
jgi:hypothetical protein